MLNLSEFVSIAEIIKSRIRRSGGFPKFPVIKIDERSDPLTCGSRTVEHRPMVPNYKIVGGSIPPYGAYPWQVNSTLILVFLTIKRVEMSGSDTLPFRLEFRPTKNI